MRVPYVSDPPPNMDAEQHAIYDRVAARRHPRPLQPLDLALLHNPHVADGWNSFLGAIRTKTSLPEDVREIAICRVAVLNGAAYEWAQHAPLAAEGGVAEEGLRTLAKKDVSGKEVGEGLSEKQWIVCRFTDEMTRTVKVSDETFADARKHFSESEVVELVSTVRGSKLSSLEKMDCKLGYRRCSWVK